MPRLEFAAAVTERQTERHARGFSSWTQFVAMLFCQLGHAQSLREITQGLAASEGRLRHLPAVFEIVIHAALIAYILMDGFRVNSIQNGFIAT